MPTESPAHTPDWWRDAVIYQVYIRSFSDGNGDGLGDVAGIASKLDHLVDLGVDAVWINPWYPSPMADGGYDVSDYRAIDPVFGTLAEAQALIEGAHAAGLRVLLDIVPNHTADDHPWFVAALAAAPGSPERQRYLFRPGRGVDGADPPNDWQSAFGGAAWTRTTDPDGTPGEWYLHLFSPQQPDLNWHDPVVRAEFESVLRFWFDRGVDGFRIDVAHGLAKDPDLPDLGRPDTYPFEDLGEDGHPFWDRELVHDIYRSWRAVADSYPEPRVFVAEAWVHSPQHLAKYVRPQHLHSAFNFSFLAAPWDAGRLRATIEESLTSLAAVGALPTWVLSNHDVARTVTRLAFDPPLPFRATGVKDLPPGVAPDLALGTRRARAAALLMLSLPGGAYVYQGEELGLPEVLDLPEDLLADPTWERSEHTDRGRDGCRVPLPWSGDAPPFGFGPPGAADPWLPQPADWGALTAEAEAADPGSVWSLYRAALRLRRFHAGLGAGSLTWLTAPDGVLAFGRDGGFVCALNVMADAADLPPHREVLLASGPLMDGRLPPDTAVWLQT